MSVISKAQLKNDFLTDKVITQPKMEDLIDSCYNVSSPTPTDEIKFFTRTLSNAEILQLGRGDSDPTVYFDLVPAPDAGEIQMPTGILCFFDYGASTAPLDNGFVGFGWEGDFVIEWDTGSYSPEITTIDWGGVGSGLNCFANCFTHSQSFEYGKDVQTIGIPGIGPIGKGIRLGTDVSSSLAINNPGGNVATLTISIWYRTIKLV